MRCRLGVLVISWGVGLMPPAERASFGDILNQGMEAASAALEERKVEGGKP